MSFQLLQEYLQLILASITYHFILLLFYVWSLFHSSLISLGYYCVDKNSYFCAINRYNCSSSALRPLMKILNKTSPQQFPFYWACASYTCLCFRSLVKLNYIMWYACIYSVGKSFCLCRLTGTGPLLSIIF